MGASRAQEDTACSLLRVARSPERPGHTGQHPWDPPWGGEGHQARTQRPRGTSSTSAPVTPWPAHTGDILPPHSPAHEPTAACAHRGERSEGTRSPPPDDSPSSAQARGPPRTLTASAGRRPPKPHLPRGRGPGGEAGEVTRGHSQSSGFERKTVQAQSRGPPSRTDCPLSISRKRNGAPETGPQAHAEHMGTRGACPPSDSSVLASWAQTPEREPCHVPQAVSPPVKRV